jgi:hypothetical protein
MTMATMIKYAIVNTWRRQSQILEFPNLDQAMRHAGLTPMEVDHGVLSRSINGDGIGLFVAEFGLGVPPDRQKYFAVRHSLFAGNAVLYAFNEGGETIDMTRMPPIVWLDGDEVEAAIQQGAIVRPQLAVNGEVFWRWPGPLP